MTSLQILAAFFEVEENYENFQRFLEKELEIEGSEAELILKVLEEKQP